MIKFLKYKKAFLIFSVVVMLPGIISIAINGLNFAIDFTGGSVFEYNAQPNSIADLEQQVSNVFNESGVEVLDIYSAPDNSQVVVETQAVEVDVGDTISNQLEAAYGETIGLNKVSFQTVGPAIGRETTKNAFLAVGVASLGIVLYIAYAFRNIPKPYSSFKFGISAIMAMIHDVTIVLGMFSILGIFYDLKIDSLFITAVLTVIGFSVHDSIVVFDRIRENLKKLGRQETFEDIVDYSIIETLNRSLGTSLTVLLPLVALLVLGGESTQSFVLALVIGIASGTYSSIFTAAPILVFWEQRNN